MSGKRSTDTYSSRTRPTTTTTRTTAPTTTRTTARSTTPTSISTTRTTATTRTTPTTTTRTTRTLNADTPTTRPRTITPTRIDRTTKTDRDRMTKNTTTYKTEERPSRPTQTPVVRYGKNLPPVKYTPLYPADSAISVGIPRKQEEYSAVVIDHGSKVLKAGVGGETIPRYVCNSLMGRPRHPGLMASMTKKDFYVGDEAQQKRDVLALNWPMDCGLITNYDDATKIWTHTYRHMEIPPEDQPLVWTEASRIRQEQREKVAEIMFETLGVPAIHFALQSVLSVYAAGLSAALVVDLGEKCDVIPVYEGGSFSHVVENSIKRLTTTGSDITENLEQILGDRGYYFTTPAEREIVASLKEQACYVAEDLSREIPQEMTLTLPDGQLITIGNERYRSAEALFVPALVGKEGQGLHALIYESIMDSEIDMRVELVRSILLSGGTSMLPGLAVRIEKELMFLAPSAKWEIGVIAPNERKYSTWIGGAILASMENFEKLCVSKEMWDEVGKDVIHDSQTW